MEVSQVNAISSSLMGEIQRTSDGSAFGKVIEKFIGDVNTQQINADAAVENLITGKTDNVQEVMLTMAQADLSFRMFMEVRNKVIDAYEQVMRQQL